MKMLNEMQREAFIDFVCSMRKATIDDETILADLEMIATNAYAPLVGFMNQEEYESVLERDKLPSGNVWTIPIVLPIRNAHYEKDERVALYYKNVPVAIFVVKDIFKRDVDREAKSVFGTTDLRHPGVEKLYSQSKICLGGEVTSFMPFNKVFPDFYMTPEQTKTEFKRRNWKTIVAFQTRNPVHRAHEYIQKCALEICDGLLLHPLVGPTKESDVDVTIRMKSYQALLDNWYSKERVVLSTFPAPMRYAGPKEAVFHAIVRKNYGCTHFIVGRDHAGVKDFYDPYAAHRIFDNLDLGITPLFFENAFYCNLCGAMATIKTCPHDSTNHEIISGTQVRETLKRGDMLPETFTRPQVAEVLRNAY